jgi:hypothetical protein
MIPWRVRIVNHRIFIIFYGRAPGAMNKMSMAHVPGTASTLWLRTVWHDAQMTPRARRGEQGGEQ